MSSQVVLFGLYGTTAEYRTNMKFECILQFADYEVYSHPINSTLMWIAAFVKPYDKPISYRDITRADIDSTLFLKRLIKKYPDLPFRTIDFDKFSPRCKQLPEPMGKLILDKTFEDDFNVRAISTCMYKYGNNTSIIKIASADFGAKEEFLLQKLYKEDRERAEVHFPNAWNPFIDDLTGLSSSSITLLPGGTVYDMRSTTYSQAEYLQFADDAITILELLDRTNIIHRDVRDSNLMVHTTKKGKRLALIDFMYSVSTDMPFSGYVPSGLNSDSYPKGFQGQCDLRAMAFAITRRFQNRQPYLSSLTQELVAQSAPPCKPNIKRLREIMDTLWKRVKKP